MLVDGFGLFCDQVSSVVALPRVLDGRERWASKSNICHVEPHRLNQIPYDHG
jgi:hypothetical protein